MNITFNNTELLEQYSELIARKWGYPEKVGNPEYVAESGSPKIADPKWQEDPEDPTAIPPMIKNPDYIKESGTPFIDNPDSFEDFIKKEIKKTVAHRLASTVRSIEKDAVKQQESARDEQVFQAIKQSMS